MSYKRPKAPKPKEEVAPQRSSDEMTQEEREADNELHGGMPRQLTFVPRNQAWWPPSLTPLFSKHWAGGAYKPPTFYGVVPRPPVPSEMLVSETGVEGSVGGGGGGGSRGVMGDGVNWNKGGSKLGGWMGKAACQAGGGSEAIAAEGERCVDGLEIYAFSEDGAKHMGVARQEGVGSKITVRQPGLAEVSLLGWFRMHGIQARPASYHAFVSCAGVTVQEYLVGGGSKGGVGREGKAKYGTGSVAVPSGDRAAHKVKLGAAAGVVAGLKNGKAGKDSKDGDLKRVVGANEVKRAKGPALKKAMSGRGGVLIKGRPAINVGKTAAKIAKGVAEMMGKSPMMKGSKVVEGARRKSLIMRQAKGVTVVSVSGGKGIVAGKSKIEQIKKRLAISKKGGVEAGRGKGAAGVKRKMEEGGGIGCEGGGKRKKLVAQVKDKGGRKKEERERKVGKKAKKDDDTEDGGESVMSEGKKNGKGILSAAAAAEGGSSVKKAKKVKGGGGGGIRGPGRPSAKDTLAEALTLVKRGPGRPRKGEILSKGAAVKVCGASKDMKGASRAKVEISVASKESASGKKKQSESKRAGGVGGREAAVDAFSPLRIAEFHPKERAAAGRESVEGGGGGKSKVDEVKGAGAGAYEVKMKRGRPPGTGRLQKMRMEMILQNAKREKEGGFCKGKQRVSSVLQRGKGKGQREGSSASSKTVEVHREAADSQAACRGTNGYAKGGAAREGAAKGGAGESEGVVVKRRPGRPRKDETNKGKEDKEDMKEDMEDKEDKEGRGIKKGGVVDGVKNKGGRPKKGSIKYLEAKKRQEMNLESNKRKEGGGKSMAGYVGARSGGDWGKIGMRVMRESTPINRFKVVHVKGGGRGDEDVVRCRSAPKGGGGVTGLSRSSRERVPMERFKVKH